MTQQQAEKQMFVNIIDGEERASATGDVLDIVNPATGEVYATSPNSGDEDVDAAFTAAATAFESQRWTTPSERQRMLLRFADVVEGSAQELAEVESENTGKPLGLTLSEEVLVLVDQIRFFAGAARVLEGRASGEYLRGYTSSVRREPRGPVAQVTPWNYPAMMAIWKLAPRWPPATPRCSSRRTRPRRRPPGWCARRRRCSRPAWSTSSAATGTPAPAWPPTRCRG